jgi:hypothetical protein
LAEQASQAGIVFSKGFSLLRASSPHRALALSHFLLAVVACMALYVFPAAGLWPILLSVIPWGARWVRDRPLFHHGLMDGLLAVFLVTAWIGYWASYDRTAAWMKLSLLLAGVLLYYAISTQPRSNLGALAAFWFVFGVGISLYFLLTLDFAISPAKFHIINQIGLKWMAIRPVAHWPGIQPSDTAAGIAIITSVYGLYFLVSDETMPRKSLIRVLVLIGFGIVLAAVVLATSRGALVALAATAGAWLVWRTIHRVSSPGWQQIYKIFPAGTLLVVGLTALLLIFPTGIFGNGFFAGENLILKRSDLIQGGIAMMRDFPFLGGGLGSFPGLFSQYILVVPYYTLLNSHNVFVDVSIEQGMIGGFAFLLLFTISLWMIASLLGRKHSRRMQVWYAAAFASIFIAMLHGLVDDYLYSGWWAALAFYPVGMSILAVGTESLAAPAATISRPPGGTAGDISLGSRRLPFRGIPLLVIGILIAGIGLTWDKITAQWLANLGAVEMAKVELSDYPANHWDDGKRINDLQSAKILFIRSLAYDAGNRIANHRLGLIKLSEKDFSSATKYLTEAYQLEPSHRGITKNLGYGYAWLGQTDMARRYLKKIPEAESEMDVYVWWWDTHGRHDLSTNASSLAFAMKHTIIEP